ncbi:hypothetical protein A9K55_001563 [Cordyceps militaris]|uniref:Uncharacterized protein n=1 Tax=Cordyceps militaris TaxID=73501 RepID=A0A2H4SQJ9_CORMI|nr:hypothetical protein A9K55_001563 [Cordyceps militaris]
MASHLTADCPLLLVACHPSANSEDQDMHPNTHQRPKHHQIRTTLAHRASADTQRFRCFQQWHAPLSEGVGILVTYYCEHQLAATPGPQKSQHRLFHHCLWSPWQLLGFLVGKLACRTGDLSPYAGSVSSPVPTPSPGTEPRPALNGPRAALVAVALATALLARCSRRPSHRLSVLSVLITVVKLSWRW